MFCNPCMKILELTNYSAGGCGVFARVKEEAQLLAEKGHEVRIFSSNLEKGTNKVVNSKDAIGKVRIERFPATKIGGESFMSWHFEDEAMHFKPDVIIAHSYRHPHTTRALRIAKKIGCKVFLVTHAPFNRERGISGNLVVYFYDKFIGRKILRDFTKVIAITKWEIPYLHALGVPESKVEYIPNGIREDFFLLKKGVEENKLLYMGRIAPIKNLQLSGASLILVKNKDIKLELFGPGETDYLKMLDNQRRYLKLQNRWKITNKSYNVKEQIKELDSCKYFILPSKSEGMPQVLVEAMARGKIVIASDIPAHRDIIQNGKNGFLFKSDDSMDLARRIDYILSLPSGTLARVKKEARRSVEQFKWSRIIRKLEDLINNQ